MMEVASTSKTSVNLYQTALFNNPQYSRVHTRRHVNITFFIQIFGHVYNVALLAVNIT
jgi:hypothetical protein